MCLTNVDKKDLFKLFSEVLVSNNSKVIVTRDRLSETYLKNNP